VTARCGFVALKCAACSQGHPASLRVVGWARDAGLDVILDLHWATAGGLVPPQSMEMPDTHSLQFWSEVANVFASADADPKSGHRPEPQELLYAAAGQLKRSSDLAACPD
jgi:hypothetical protein